MLAGIAADGTKIPSDETKILSDVLTTPPRGNDASNRIHILSNFKKNEKIMLELNLSQNTNSTLQANGYNPNGKYYAKVETKEQYTLEKLAEHMHEHNAAFSAGLIQGVLVDMVTCIKHLVLAGCTVKIPNLGIFKCSVEANGLTLAKGAKISAGKGSQRTDAELQSNIAAQQFAIGAVKVIMQATGETSKDEVSNKAKMTFTSKAKALIKSKTGADATDGEGTATSGDDEGSGSSDSGSQNSGSSNSGSSNSGSSDSGSDNGGDDNSGGFETGS